ncbi:hypothetical protein QQF64_003340 [Cirrhinus molitorella]|uniref:Secreted protein n=1 Tax=Cirrhinus molitorella TaxID=172907 RepID=A0ABR3ML33_9TELE
MLCAVLVCFIGAVWAAHVLKPKLFTSAHIEKHVSLHVSHESNCCLQYLDWFPSSSVIRTRLRSSGELYELTAESRRAPLFYLLLSLTADGNFLLLII